MGMLSNQTDSLREEASWLAGQGHPIGAELMMEAADTIDSLRNVAQEAQAENARLRQLASGMYGMLETFDRLLGTHDACETPRPLIFGEDKSFKDVMRELGIEVD